MEKWEAIDIEKSEYIGIIEFQDNKDEWHNFEVVKTDDHLVFGGSCNIGLLQSGYMLIDKFFSLDENLQELLADLECYYRDGPEYVSDIVCNERM